MGRPAHMRFREGCSQTKSWGTRDGGAGGCRSDHLTLRDEGTPSVEAWQWPRTILEIVNWASVITHVSAVFQPTTTSTPDVVESETNCFGYHVKPVQVNRGGFPRECDGDPVWDAWAQDRVSRPVNGVSVALPVPVSHHSPDHLGMDATVSATFTRLSIGTAPSPRDRHCLTSTHGGHRGRAHAPHLPGGLETGNGMGATTLTGGGHGRVPVHRDRGRSAHGMDGFGPSHRVPASALRHDLLGVDGVDARGAVRSRNLPG